MGQCQHLGKKQLICQTVSLHPLSLKTLKHKSPWCWFVGVLVFAYNEVEALHQLWLLKLNINIRHQLGPAVTQQPLGPRHQAEGSPQFPGPTRCHPAAPGTDETGNSVTRCTRCLTVGPSPSPCWPPSAGIQLTPWWQVPHDPGSKGTVDFQRMLGYHWSRFGVSESRRGGCGKEDLHERKKTIKAGNEKL